jgi:hypothetical protein
VDETVSVLPECKKPRQEGRDESKWALAETTKELEVTSSILFPEGRVKSECEQYVTIVEKNDRQNSLHFDSVFNDMFVVRFGDDSYVCKAFLPQ